MNYIWQGVNAVSLAPVACDYINLLENINVCIRVKDILNVVDQLFFFNKSACDDHEKIIRGQVGI
ncbi:hypothetical protein NBRC116495_21510 [Aurantivibrio plasticivorans]